MKEDSYIYEDVFDKTYVFKHKSGSWLSSSELNGISYFVLVQDIEHATALYELPESLDIPHEEFEKKEACILAIRINDIFNDIIDFESGEYCHIPLSHCTLIDGHHDEISSACAKIKNTERVAEVRQDIIDYLKDKEISPKEVVIYERLIHSGDETDTLYVNIWPQHRILH